MKKPKIHMRKRKDHTRSRDGCWVCRKKHIRCDELKPICTHCRNRGLICIYPASLATPTVSSRSQHPEHYITDNYAAGSLIKPQSLLPGHGWSGYPIDMSYESRMLFDVGVRYASIDARSASTLNIERSVREPGRLHAAILVGAVQWSWHHESTSYIRHTWLQHQGEAIKYVNTQLSSIDSATADTTLATIVGLALAESVLGSRQNALAHIAGMSRILSYRKATKSNENIQLIQTLMQKKELFHGLFQASAKSSSEHTDKFQEQISDVVEDTLVQDPGSEPEQDMIQMAMSQFLSETLDRPGDVPMTVARRVPFGWCWVFIYMTMRQHDMDLMIMGWYLDTYREGILILESKMVDGTYSRDAWMATVLLGCKLLEFGKCTTWEEATQLKSWRSFFFKKIQLASRVMGIWSRDDAKQLFEAWLGKGAAEADDLVLVWEEALKGVQPKTPATVPVFIHQISQKNVT